MGGLIKTEAWQKLLKHHQSVKDQHLRDLFAADMTRVDSFSVSAGLWRLDYSKNNIINDTQELLFDLARERKVEVSRDAMFAGENINKTENRPALHVALRNPADSHITASGEDIMPGIKHNLGRMGAFVTAMTSGNWVGHTGKPIKTIVNIGIGGSELGSRMAVEALQAYHNNDLNILFDANVDETEFYETVIAQLDPEETLFVVVSKSFGTDETMTNALSARLWLTDKMDESALDKHFIAITSNLERAVSFGIPENNTFKIWDWVGGRFSMTSAVGLSIMLAIGYDRFISLLAGFHDIDEHFRTAPLEHNMPVIMALVSIWNSNFMGARSEAVIPYSYYLRSFPPFVQQLSMESNGKLVDAEGSAVQYHTAPVIWGQSGTNGQHSFFQLLHQGTQVVPIDCIAFHTSNRPHAEHHRKLLANMIAQTEALAFGHSVNQLIEEGTPQELLLHKAMPGNRYSNSLTSQKLNPRSLGQLIALYEHKTFVQGIIWGINSFDQWGVEYGKKLAQQVYSELKTGAISPNHDSSTIRLIEELKN